MLRCIIYVLSIVLFRHISNGGNMGGDNLQSTGQQVVEVIFRIS